MAAASGQVVLVTAALTRVTLSAAVNITKHASHLAFITFSCLLRAGISGEAATDHIAHPPRRAPGSAPAPLRSSGFTVTEIDGGIFFIHVHHKLTVLIGAVNDRYGY